MFTRKVNCKHTGASGEDSIQNCCSADGRRTIATYICINRAPYQVDRRFTSGEVWYRATPCQGHPQGYNAERNTFSELPLSRRYRADQMYKVKRLNEHFATDTLYSTNRSISGNIACQLYTHKVGFLRSTKGEDVGNTLSDFIQEYGVPEQLTFDGAQNQVGPNMLFMKNIHKVQIQYHISSPRRPNENPAKAGI